jgi:membrane associated rhomboid family serine protease
MPDAATAESPQVPSPEDIQLAEKIDEAEGRFLERGASVLGSGIGLASIVGGFGGPEGAVAGALVGAAAGYLLPAIREYRLRRRSRAAV